VSDSRSDRDSVTEVAEESFVRERPLEIERGAVLAGRYQVEEVIGKGGSGVVLRVFDRTVQNVVALKVLKSELARDAKWDKRFSRELRLGRPIQHPNVCRIFDIGEADGHRFLTMELATGGSLRDELKRQPALERPIVDRLLDARAAIEGLAAIHASGVVHRDFKPDNLLRMEDGRLVISDFGLATDAANAPGVTVMIGTPHYMAPEVLAGEPATTRSDVWALGVVLHEIFFGRRPERKTASFDGREAGPLLLTTQLERQLLRLCERCLTESPLERPADARAVLEDFVKMSYGSARRKGSVRARLIVVTCLAISAAVAAVVVLRRGGGRTGGDVLVPQGHAQDLSTRARLVRTVADHIHCFSLMDENRARIIWGSPRRAEDIDLRSGAPAPADLVPESYQVGCPQSQGGSVLFTGRTQSGVTDVRLSASPNGADASVLTVGSEPLWVKGGEQFVYSLDSDHAAVFSIPTMTFEVLADPALGAEYGIKDKAVSAAGDQIAVLYSNLVRDAVVLYEGHLFSKRASPFLSRAKHIAFGPERDELLVLGINHEPTVSLNVLNWTNGEYSRVGYYPGLDLVEVATRGRELGLVGAPISNNVWRTSPGPVEQLTFDGRAYSAALSGRGDLLVSRRDDEGNLNVWLQRVGGTAVRITYGTEDVEPSFAPDGRTWAYADYVRRAILVCEVDSRSCRVLHTDALVPTWPSFSPDGTMLVFMTQLRTTTFTAVAVTDGQVLSRWEGTDRCSPAWSSAAGVWTVEGGLGQYAWSERDARTGRRVSTVPIPSTGPAGRIDCTSAPGLSPDGGGRRPAVEIRTVESPTVLSAGRG